MIAETLHTSNNSANRNRPTTTDADKVFMSQSAILHLETIENAFIVGLLLTGGIEQAERAIVDSIHCSETEDVCGQRVFRRVIQWAVDPQEQRSCRVIDEASVRILPFELGCVLHLPPDLRHCYVLRILVGLSREVCAWLLHTGVEQISQRTQSALNSLAQVHSSFGASELRSRVAQQMKLSAFRNDGARVLRQLVTGAPELQDRKIT